MKLIVLVGLLGLAQFTSAAGVVNIGQTCLKQCGKQGPCPSFCGTGMCCQDNFADKSNGCDDTIRYSSPTISSRWHVCSFQKGTPDNTPKSGPISDIALRWVKQHNIQRCMHGSPPVVWSNAVAAAAQKWANNGKFEHGRPDLNKDPAGPTLENIALGSPGVEQATKLWYGEYDFCTKFPGCDPGKNGQETGHFKSMIWKTTTEIGCGIGKAQHNGASVPLYVCQYKGDPRVICSGLETHLTAGCKEENILAKVKSESACIAEIETWMKSYEAQLNGKEEPKKTETETETKTETKTETNSEGVTKCADENNICKCNGEVRYGKNKWTSWRQTVNGEIWCNNPTFGDPDAGASKQCECRASSAPTGCTKSGYYEPTNGVQGQGRSEEKDWVGCQARCAGISGCAFFSFWSDGGCHLQSAGATFKSGSGMTSGPRTCGTRLQASNGIVVAEEVEDASNYHLLVLLGALMLVVTYSGYKVYTCSQEKTYTAIKEELEVADDSSDEEAAKLLIAAN